MKPLPQNDNSSGTDLPIPQPTPAKMTIGEMGDLLSFGKEPFFQRTTLTLYRNGKTELKQKAREIRHEKSA